MGEYGEAVDAFLLSDCQRFARAARGAADPGERLAPYAIAAAIGVSEGTTRKILSDDWSPKPWVLRLIEAEYHTHPLWRPTLALAMRPLSGGDGFVCRRLVDPDGAGEFADLLEAWRLRSSDEAFIYQATRDPKVSVVNVEAGDPADYYVAHYSPDLVALHGYDKTGQVFAENRFPTYGRAIMEDFGECWRSGRPMVRDVYRRYRRISENILFRNITLPCPDAQLIISKALVVQWHPGSVFRS